MFEFDADTSVERVADDEFRAQVTDRWNHFLGPNGGYLLAIATRALGERLPLPHPLAVSGHFMRPARPGPAEIRTELIRAGRRHATGAATLRQDGKDVLAVTATFADLVGAAGGRTLTLNEPPKLPPPEEAVDPTTAFPPDGLPPIARRVDVRLADVPGWGRGAPSGDPSAEFWVRFADGRAPDPLSLVYFVDGAAPPVVGDIGELVSTTVELTVHVRGAPAPGWLACRAYTRHVSGGYHEEDVEVWDSEGRLVAQSRQLAILGS